MAVVNVNDYATSNEPGTETSHTVQLPTTISSGDLLIAFFTCDGDPATISFPNEGTDWIVLNPTTESDKTPSAKICYRIAGAGEGGTTITVTTADSEQSSHIVLAITGHDSGSNVPESATFAVSTSAIPDPPSLEPTGGSKEYLWIVFEGHDHTDTTDAWPTNYSSNNYTSYSAGNGGCGCAVGTYNYEGTTQDPSTFTISGTEQWIAGTVAVYPVSATTYTKAFTVDALVKKTESKDFMADARLTKTGITKTFTADAIVGIGYLEKFDSFAPPTQLTWAVYDIRSNNNIPPGSICEIVMVNTSTTADTQCGVRENGSGINRYVTLQRATNGGVDTARMHVKVDSGGLISVYGDTTNTTFYIVSYWFENSTDYTEEFTTKVVTAPNIWEPINIGSANSYYEILIRNKDPNNEITVGARQANSGNYRVVTLHDCDTDSASGDFTTLFVKTNGAGLVEFFSTDEAEAEFIVLGEFTPPTNLPYYMERAEEWNSGSTGWIIKDMSGFGVGSGDVSEILCLNKEGTTEKVIGTRRVDSTKSRYFNLHEAAGGGTDSASFHVEANGGTNIETYTGVSGITTGYIITGFWSATQKYETWRKSFTVNAYISERKDKELTVDAIITGQAEKSFTTDALILKTSAKDFTTDAFLEKAQTKQLTVDALIEETLTKDFTTDARIIRSYTKSFTANALIEKATEKTFTADAFVLDSFTKDFTVDASIIRVYTKSFTVDSYIEKTTAKELTADALILKSTPLSFTTDARIVKGYTKTFTSNAYIQKGQTKDFTADAFVQKEQTKSFVVDGNIGAGLVTYTKTFTTDAFIQKQQSISFTVDANIIGGISKSFTVDAFIKKTLEIQFTIDSFILKSIAKEFTVDVIIYEGYSKQFTVNAVISKEYLKDFTTDSILLKLQTKDFTVDTIIGGASYISFTTDALILKQQTKSFVTDAFIQKSQTKTFVADAIVVNIYTKSFTVDAEISQCITLRPIGVGNSSNLTVFGDTPGWKCVDEESSDGDTTYVKAVSDSWTKDTYDIQTTDSTGTIVKVTVRIHARIEAA